MNRVERFLSWLQYAGEVPDTLKWHQLEKPEGRRYKITGRVKEIKENRVELMDPREISPYTLLLEVNPQYAELLKKRNPKILYVWGDLFIYPNKTIFRPEKDESGRYLVEIKA